KNPLKGMDRMVVDTVLILVGLSARVRRQIGLIAESTHADALIVQAVSESFYEMDCQEKHLPADGPSGQRSCGGSQPRFRGDDLILRLHEVSIVHHNVVSVFGN